MRRTGAPKLLATALAIALIGLWTAAALGPAPAVAVTRTTTAAVPFGFVGVDADGPMLDPPSGLNLATQFNSMVATGIDSVRVAFNWALAQPYQSWSDVPAGDQSQYTDVGGVPTNFSQTDQLVELAAQRGMTVLPTVLYAPQWDAVSNPNGVDYPAQPGPYADYLTALIGRYGPRGSFWSSHPGLPRTPIRTWQIWNEENLSYYWRQPFAKSYVALLSAARGAIKRADHGAKVVLGALTNLAWQSIGNIYRVKGARRLFDMVAVNGFTKKPANVILYLRLMRRAMDHFGDGRKPLIASELSWPSALHETTTHFDWDTTQAGQAHNIAALLPLLGAQRVSLGLQSFYYYTWIGLEGYGQPDFSFAGLVGLTERGSVFTKPALGAFRRGALALEKCKRKSTNARRCAQSAR